MYTLEMKEGAEKIYNLSIEKHKKIMMLKEFLLDFLDGMQAQDKNMHPKVQYKVSEGYRLVKDFLHKLNK